MSQYEIKHTCGHSITHVICGSNTKGQRDRKIDWLSSCPCDACYVAAMISEQSDLPALVGSEKQIKWALEIRATALSVLDEAVKKIKAAEGDVSPHVTAAVAAIRRQTSAGWWIEQRHAGSNPGSWARVSAALCHAPA